MLFLFRTTLSDALCDGLFPADQPDPAGLGAVKNGENEATCQNGSRIRGLERAKATNEPTDPSGRPGKCANEATGQLARREKRANEANRDTAVWLRISSPQCLLPCMGTSTLREWDVGSGTTLQAGTHRAGRLEPRSIPARSGGDDVPGLDAWDHAAQAPAIRERPGGAGPVRRSASRGGPLGRRSSKMLTPLRRCSLS